MFAKQLRSNVVTMQQGGESMLPILNRMEETVNSFAVFLQKHRQNCQTERFFHLWEKDRA